MRGQVRAHLFNGRVGPSLPRLCHKSERMCRRHSTTTPRGLALRWWGLAPHLYGVIFFLLGASGLAAQDIDPCDCAKEEQLISGTLKDVQRGAGEIRQPSWREVSGLWCWRVNCPVSGIWKGMLRLEGVAGSLAGPFMQCTPGDSGSISAGRIESGRMRLRREVPTFSGTIIQIWDGVFYKVGQSQTLFVGEASHAMEICNAFATKKVN